MNETELTITLAKNCKYFKGVYAADEIFHIKPPAFIVVNTDERGERGQHWIAMYIKKGIPEFFDSLGKTPASYHKYWHKFLLKRLEKYICNDSKLQQTNSEECGKFCLAYCILRSKGMSYKSIIKFMKKTKIDKVLNCLTVTGTALTCV